jgi:hypothetical protein
MKKPKAKTKNFLSELLAQKADDDMEFYLNYPESMDQLFDSLSISEISFSFVPKVVEYFDLSDFILKDRLRSLLYQMKQLTKKQITVFSQYEQNLHYNITILYGRCSSQLSFIFNVFTGASLARVLS